jgi:histidyl-tRNA synthetase
MQKLGLVKLAPSTAQVLVTVMDPSHITDYQMLTRELRQAGINTELYLGEEKSLAKQLQYANRQEIPVAVIIGSNEFAENEVTIKNLKRGAELQDTKKTARGKERDEWLKVSRSAQVTVRRQQCLEQIRTMLNSE